MDLKNSSVDFAVRAQRIVIENSVVEAMGIVASLFNEHSQLILERWMMEHVRIIEMQQEVPPVALASAISPHYIETAIENMKTELFKGLRQSIECERTSEPDGSTKLKLILKIVK